MLVPARLATLRGSEEAWLLHIGDCLAGILVRIGSDSDEQAEEGWWLEIGFGPWSREGLMFPTLEAAEAWMHERLPPGWVPTGASTARPDGEARQA